MTYQAGITRFSAGRFALALLAALALFMVFAFSTVPVTYADGSGSPVECDGKAENVEGSITGTDDSATATAPEGQVVLGVCIKAGQLHTGPLGDADSNDCYTISGVGTASATVTRIGDGPDCQGISHIDAVFGSAPGDDDDDDDDDTGDDDDDDDTGDDDDDDDTGDDDDDDDTGDDDDDDDTGGGNPPPGEGTLGGNPPTPDTAMSGPTDAIVPMLVGLFVLAAFGGLTALRLARRP
jgi:hypothetical protein